MLTTISDYVSQLWRTGRKTSSGQNGWISANAVCCIHNGESSDSRGRGGIIIGSNGEVSYSCFNCGFKVSYTTGHHLNYKFRKLLQWMGADQSTIGMLTIEAIRIKELYGTVASNHEEKEVSFPPITLPHGSISFSDISSALRDDIVKPSEVPQRLCDAIDYIHDRGDFLIEDYEFFWSDAPEYGLEKRVIIPFYWKSDIVGFTARSLDNSMSPKYYSKHPSDYVFNIDRQAKSNKFVIVCEGAFDAMSVDGVSVQHSEISEQQANIIDSLGKKVIVVPDFDVKLNPKTGKKKWSGEGLVKWALEYGWSVSYPIWSETCKDINSAAAKYGKLFTLYAILHACEDTPLKIRLMANKQFNGRML